MNQDTLNKIKSYKNSKYVSVYVPPGKMKSYRKWLKKAGLKCQGGKKWKR